MSSKLEKVYLTLLDTERGGKGLKAYPSLLFVTLIYLIAVLSVPIFEPHKLVWLAAYPIILAEMTGIGYGRIFIKSLWILPLLILIALFNPIYDTEKINFASFVINRGWISFFSILLRGVLSLQSVLILVFSIGFIDIFNLMRRIGFPTVLCTQMLLSYRYLLVIVDEAIVMVRARESRGFGRKSYPLSLWGQFVGQLLIRSWKRAIRIHRAMKARGFIGVLPLGKVYKWTFQSWAFLIIWILIIACLRFIDFSHYFKELLL